MKIFEKRPYFILAVLFGGLLGGLLGGCKPPAADPDVPDNCTKDSECGGTTPYCSPGGHCVECREPAHCADCHQGCDENGHCYYLADRGDMQSLGGTLRFCLPENECEPGVNCCNLGFFCNIYSGQCLAVADYSRNCTTELSCPDGMLCDIYHHVCVPQPNCQSQENCCTVDERVPGVAMTCSAAGKCNNYEIVCTPPEAGAAGCPFLPKDGAECPDGKFCVPPGICVQCTCDDDCPVGSNLVCNQATGLCKSAYSCTNSSECDDNYLCDTSTGRCVPRCTLDVQCGFEEYCNTDVHFCRPESQRPCSLDDYEPNDDKSAAAVLADKPALVEGMKCPGDQDWYRLMLKRADQVTIRIYETKESAGTIYLDAFMPDGQTLLGSTNNGFFAKNITFTANEDGDYYLWVYTTTPESALSYAMAFNYDTGAVCEDLLESGVGDNGSPETAADLFSGYGLCRTDMSVATKRRVNCEGGDLVICAGDRDYYHVPVANGQLLTASMTSAAPLKLSMITPSGLVVPAAIKTGGSQVLQLAARPGGDYYLAVGASGMEQGNYNLDLQLWDGNKELSCREDGYDALAYNDDVLAFSNSSKAKLASGINEITANLCLGDQDGYYLQLGDGLSDIDIPAGYRLTGTLLGDENNLASVTLYQRVADNFEPVAGGGHSFQMPITSGRPLYVAVTSAQFAAAVDYRLQLLLEPPPVCENDRYEPSETPVDAVALAAGNYNGLALCKGDADWYKIQTENGTTLLVDIIYDKQLPAPACALYNERVLNSSDFADPATYQGLVISCQELRPGWQRLRVVQGGGTYYLQVNNKAGWPLSSYEIKVVVSGESCKADEFTLSGNGSAAAAANLLLAGISSEYNYFNDSLTLCGAGEEDWYSVAAAAGDMLDIKVHYRPGEGNLDLYLYPPAAAWSAGAVSHLAYDWDDTAPYKGELALSYTVPEGQAQQLWPFVVRPYQAAGVSSFNNLYSLEVTVNRDCLADSVGAAAPPSILDGQSDSGYLVYQEGAFATYSPLSLAVDGSDLSGTLSLCGNEDWFVLALPGAAAVTACADFIHSDGDIDIQLYHADNLNKPVAESATKHDYETIIFTNDQEMEYYYLRVFLDPRDSGKKVTYRLRIFGGSDYETAGCQLP